MPDNNKAERWQRPERQAQLLRAKARRRVKTKAAKASRRGNR